MTNGIEQYIRETAEVEREELIAFGKVDVFVKDQLPKNVNLAKVLYIIRQTLPEKYLHGLEEIHVSNDAKFAERDINAYYSDMKLYISPDQDNERDMIDDIIHEMAHHLEVIAAEEIYADRAILDEFITKRKQLNFELRSEGYDTSEHDFENGAYDKDFRTSPVLYKKIEELHQLAS